MAVKKATKKATSSRGFSVRLQMPGHDPETVKVAKGATVQDVVEAKNLKGYIVSIAGEEVALSTPLAKDDLLRVGVKTKNA